MGDYVGDYVSGFVGGFVGDFVGDFRVILELIWSSFLGLRFALGIEWSFAFYIGFLHFALGFCVLHCVFALCVVLR